VRWPRPRPTFGPALPAGHRSMAVRLLSVSQRIDRRGPQHPFAPVRHLDRFLRSGGGSGSSATAWMVSARVPDDQAEARTAAAIAGGGHLLTGQHPPAFWLLADRGQPGMRVRADEPRPSAAVERSHHRARSPRLVTRVSSHPRAPLGRTADHDGQSRHRRTIFQNGERPGQQQCLPRPPRWGAWGSNPEPAD
jgi:hypothetical protein